MASATLKVCIERGLALNGSPGSLAGTQIPDIAADRQGLAAWVDSVVLPIIFRYLLPTEVSFLKYQLPESSLISCFGSYGEDSILPLRHYAPAIEHPTREQPWWQTAPAKP